MKCVSILNGRDAREKKFQFTEDAINRVENPIKSKTVHLALMLGGIEVGDEIIADESSKEKDCRQIKTQRSKGTAYIGTSLERLIYYIDERHSPV